jgi:hypothetical protein
MYAVCVATYARPDELVGSRTRQAPSFPESITYQHSARNYRAAEHAAAKAAFESREGTGRKDLGAGTGACPYNPLARNGP